MMNKTFVPIKETGVVFLDVLAEEIGVITGLLLAIFILILESRTQKITTYDDRLGQLNRKISTCAEKIESVADKIKNSMSLHQVNEESRKDEILRTFRRIRVSIVNPENEFYYLEKDIKNLAEGMTVLWMALFAVTGGLIIIIFLVGYLAFLTTPLGSVAPWYFFAGIFIVSILVLLFVCWLFQNLRSRVEIIQKTLEGLTTPDGKSKAVENFIKEVDKTEKAYKRKFKEQSLRKEDENEIIEDLEKIGDILLSI